MMIRKTNTKKPTKRLVIKSLSNIPKLPDNFYENTLNKLIFAIDAIRNSKPISDSMESLYNSVKDLCVHKYSEDIYKKLRNHYSNYLTQDGKLLQNNLHQGVNKFSLLNQLHDIWNNHCSQIRMIRDIFLYLDRTFVYQTKDHSIWDMGCLLFRSQIMDNKQLCNKIISTILELYENERNNQTIERYVIQNLLRMFISIKLYKSNFENEFLQTTDVYYTKEGNDKLISNSVPYYLRYVEQRLNDEYDRGRYYLSNDTIPKLILIIEDKLIRKQSCTILDKGFFILMEDNSMSDLTILYKLFNKVDTLDDIKSFLNTFVKKNVLQIVMDTKSDSTMIDNLINFKEKLDSIWKTCFQSNHSFLESMKEAFTNSINKRKNIPAELLAKYVNTLLRTGGKNYSESELELKLDNVVVIFRFINGKDIFQEYYRRNLSKRLLIGKLINTELEMLMISKLKLECGSAFTSKLEGMFNDVNVSKELTQEFHQLDEYKEYLVDMNINILTTGTWPSFTPVDVNLPSIFTQGQELFEKFYENRFNGRKLTWQHSMGHTALTARFPSGEKIITMSVLQAIVMLLYNSKNKLTYAEIREATGINDKELKATLLPLFTGKARLLVKNPKSNAINDDSQFIWNKVFKHKLVRIKVNQIQMKETDDERKSTQEGVFLERQYQIDAAIVRVMKTRKSLTHPLLLTELYNQLRFPVEPVDIKKRIESLIERDYLERDEDKNQLYHYLA